MTTKKKRTKKTKEEKLEYTREKSRRWRAENPDRKKKENAEYYLRHPEERLGYNRKRRAIKHNAPGDGVTREQWKLVLMCANGRCYYCGKKSDKLEMDHITPLTRGGADDITNVIPVCKKCNSSKGTKIFCIEWTPPTHGEYND